VRRVWTTIFATLMLAGITRADFIGTVNKGNDAFRKKDYKTALEMYHSAETDRPESPELKYNIAGAQHQQGSFKEAIEQYQGALKTTDIGLEAEAQYNLGSTYYRMKEYENAIKSFEESLKLNPKDMDAKFNLELARKMLKEQLSSQNQDNQQQKQDQKQQQQQQQQQQGQQNKDQQKDQQDKQNQKDQQNQQDKDKQQQKQNAQKDEKKMSKEDAERILNALRDDEQDIQKKVKRETTQGDYVGKDW
jgi:tetratricopeptide (TPR) repeat protein